MKPCHKVGYTKRDAESVLSALSHRHGRRHGLVASLRIYHCPDCGLWHITKHV